MQVTFKNPFFNLSALEGKGKVGNDFYEDELGNMIPRVSSKF